MEPSQDASKFAYVFDHGQLRVRWLAGTAYRHGGAVDMADVHAADYNRVSNCPRPFFYPVDGWILRCPKLRAGATGFAVFTFRLASPQGWRTRGRTDSWRRITRPRTSRSS